MSETSHRDRIPAGARRTLRALVSALTAVAVVLITAAVLVAGLAAPTTRAEQVPATQVDIGAGPLHLLCPDAPRLSTDEAGTDIDYDAEFGTDAGQVRASTGAVVVGAEGAPPEQVEMGALGEQTEQAHSGTGAWVYTDSGTTIPTVLTAGPAQDRTPLGAAHAAARADAGDLRGLSVANCLPPSATQWLVGGTSEPGSSARLLLTNAGQTPVTATVDMWGDTGRVESPATVLVPAQESRSLLLETVSLEERLAVRVTADGGNVAAAIQDSALAGVVPAGTDMVTAGADPATLINIGPVQVTEAEAEGDPPVLRLVNPATTAATVSVDLLTGDGPEMLAGAQDQVLEPGTVTDVSLAGVEPGALAVQVHSDIPVTGSVLRTVVGAAGELDPGEPVRDRAWLGAQDAVERGLLTIPDDLTDSVSVLIANPLPQAQQVQVRTIDSDGSSAEPVTVEVPRGGAIEVDTDQVPLAEAVALEISGAAVLATLMARGEAQDGPLLSMLTLTPDAAAAQQVPVRLGSW